MAQSIFITRNLFLWSMSAIYLFAFSSLYVQIPGLYGDNGILPARLVLTRKGHTAAKKFQEQPTLLWFMEDYGLSASEGMELLSLLGMAGSLLCLLSHRVRDSMSFAVLWFLYLSVYQVGQTFLWFQWDILLLEAGFLTILVAPLQLVKWKRPRREDESHDPITLWLVRWLLFRLMYASGVVKLTSMCPTWWGLTALNYHYETQMTKRNLEIEVQECQYALIEALITSQCISTPLAWYAHQLPEWWQKLSVVATYVIEMAIPFLFFAPIRNLRLFSFWSQVFLQVLIILTGNYNFFNLLTIALCISLLDDSDLGYQFREKLQGFPKMATRLVSAVVCGLLAYWTFKYFNISVDWQAGSVDSEIVFSEADFFEFVHTSVIAGIWIGSLSLASVIILAIWRSLSDGSSISNKIWSFLKCLLFTLVAVYMFCISLPSLTVVDRDAHHNLAPIVHNWKSRSDFLSLTHSYGLFRRMTGVGGRPEVIIEGSNNLTAGWKPYEFLYKPGNVSAVPAIVAPHQPRLDWQMWFAALGNVRGHPWLVSLVNRLLNNQPEVLHLMDRNPFPEAPPKFIRAKLYHYHFTSVSQDTTDWWRRKEVETYLNPVTKETDIIKTFVERSGMGKRPKQMSDGIVRRFLSLMREYVGKLSGPVLIYSMFVPVLIINYFS